ncbi:mevalonate kinase [Nocardia tenerifensis]|uniref:mevalonate kinase n=1 Tax=Nocardia tenerifensis TaxID=228006 RepID=A0A318KCD2_9NOCA|nr:mevalonate kinase [Nocardia tenerifensis]PXX71786.1 mevalonate kinase [Nocardia tenerifensis]
MTSQRVHERGGAAADPGNIRGAGRAHAKTILVGEHTVVHGTPALAFPLPALSVRAIAGPVGAVKVNSSVGQQLRFVTESTSDQTEPMSGPRVAVEEALRRWGKAGAVVEVVVDCAIPHARGLGSSAACAGAAVRAVADLYGESLDATELYELVQRGEQVAHGRASGVDASAVSADGPIWFQAGVSRPLTINLDAALVIADTGTYGATQRAVAAVRRKLEREPLRANRLLRRAEELIGSAAADLSAGRAEPLGSTLLAFHDLLDELGVSTPQLDNLVTAAMKAGALGAKLTGAGHGGCVLALTETGDAERVSAALRRAGAAQTWILGTREPHTTPLSPTMPERDTRR